MTRYTRPAGLTPSVVRTYIVSYQSPQELSSRNQHVDFLRTDAVAFSTMHPVCPRKRDTSKRPGKVPDLSGTRPHGRGLDGGAEFSYSVITAAYHLIYKKVRQIGRVEQ